MRPENRAKKGKPMTTEPEASTPAPDSASTKAVGCTAFLVGLVCGAFAGVILGVPLVLACARLLR
jgi:hypothetical protein